MIGPGVRITGKDILPAVIKNEKIAQYERNPINLNKSMTKRTDIHERVLTATSKDELNAAYKEWAGAYDTDLVDEMGYVAPEITVDKLLEVVKDPEARILDAGCGTGLVGEVLHRRGYHHIDGLDYSRDMLDIAEQKHVYALLSQGDLTTRLSIPDQTYDAVISVGTFTCGHVGPEALAELIRVTRSGGHICFTVREEAWDAEGYQSIMDEAEQNGLWFQISRQKSDYIIKEGSSCAICLYGVSH